jgi:hypothetical protein
MGIPAYVFWAESPTFKRLKALYLTVFSSKYRANLARDGTSNRLLKGQLLSKFTYRPTEFLLVGQNTNVHRRTSELCMTPHSILFSISNRRGTGRF